MRCEVFEQTWKFHNDAFRGNSTIPCGITGLPLTRKKTHVDHAFPISFHVLVSDFLKEIGLRIKDVAVTSEGRLNSCSAKYLTDRELASKWQIFHQQHAQLRITSKLANLSQKKVKVDFSEIR